MNFFLSIPLAAFLFNAWNKAAFGCDVNAQEHSCGDTMNTCVHQSFWCNGKVDCPNEADESISLCRRYESGMFVDFSANLKSKDISTDNKTIYEEDACVLTTFPLGCECSRGTMITCSGMSLTSVPQNIRPAESLQKLNLSNNEYTTLPDGVFEAYPNLTTIIIHDNKLNRIERNAFNGLLKLVALWLDNNQLSEFEKGTFLNVPKLRLLHFFRNNFTDWDPDVFLGNHTIQWLDVRHNQVQLKGDNMFVHLNNSKYLEFDHNNIEEITDETFKHLTDLSLLSLAHNQIACVSENAFINLQLSELMLSFNRISTLHTRQFRNQPVLRDIHLSHNQLKYLPENLFHGLHALVRLELEGMDIMNISKKMFNDSSLGNMEHIFFEKFHYCAYAPRVKDCNPKTDGISSAENLLDSFFLRVSSWIIALLALFVNGFVVTARLYLWKGSSQLTKVHSLCITSLAASDLVLGVYMFIISTVDEKYKDQYYLYSHQWQHSSLCNFCGLLLVLSSEVSTLLLMFMAIERYTRLVWRPFGRCAGVRCGTSLRMAIGWILACWIIGFSTALLPLLVELGDPDRIRSFYGQNGVCLPLFIHEPYFENWWISALIFIATPLVAILVITWCYASIFFHVERSRLASERSADKTHLRRVLAITVSNNISWIPVIVIKLLALTWVYIPSEVYGYIAVLILPVNCCLNPIIYTLLTPEFKAMMKRCPSHRSRAKAEANALQQIVSYTSGLNSLSRSTMLNKTQLRGCTSVSTMASRFQLSHQNSINFSRQGSAYYANNRNRPESRRSNLVPESERHCHAHSDHTKTKIDEHSEECGIVLHGIRHFVNCSSSSR